MHSPLAARTGRKIIVSAGNLVAFSGGFCFFLKNKISLIFINGHHIGYHPSGDGKSRSVSVSFLQFSFMYTSQLCVPTWGNLGGLNERALEMLVAFLRNRPPLFLACRFFLPAAETAVTDGLTDGLESQRITDLQGPG